MEGIRVSEIYSSLRFQEGSRGIKSRAYCLNKNSFLPIEFQDGSNLDPKENDRVALFSARCGLILFQTWTQRKPKGKRTGGSFLFILISRFNIFLAYFYFLAYFSYF
jgi:hypothetical protein